MTPTSATADYKLGKDEKTLPAAPADALSPLPHLSAATAALMERTPFAIDDAGDEDEDDFEGHEGLEDDDRVLDEVDAFLEAHDSGLTEADQELAKGKH